MARIAIRDVPGGEVTKLTGKELLLVDTGEKMAPATIENVVTPVAESIVTEAIGELNLGTAAEKAVEDFATAAQGALADTAIQPNDLAAVATSGDYDDLINKPSFGTAAFEDIEDFATAAQGALAESAVQPGDLAKVATTGAYSDLTGAPAAIVDSDFSANGIMVRTAEGSYTSRTVTAGTGIAITNGDGKSGNPTVALSSGAQSSLSLADSAVQPGDLGDLAVKDKIEISDIDAKGSPSSSTFLRGDGEWATPAGGGTVSGPESSKDGNFAAFDGTDGTKIKDSGKSASDFATAAQGALADTAVQPDDLGDLALKDKIEVSDIDAQGTAGATTYLRGDGTWATPAGGGGEGGQVDAVVAGTGIAVDNNDPTAPIVGLDSATQASLALADTAVQPGDLAAVATSGDYDDLKNKPEIPQGTVTSVGLSAPTGLTVSGSPVTTSGTLTLSWDTGYQGYTSAEAAKLAGIESGADVTDATNVAAAGAVMDGDFSSNGLMTRTGAGTYGITAIGTGAGTVAAGDDSRITGAVQKAGTGQVLTGSYLHTPYNYGNLGSSTITLNPANGLTGKITRTSGSGTIEAPTGTPSGFFNMLVAIVGTSSTGSTSLSGFDHVDGDDLPGNNQTAALYVECCPDYKLALVKGVKGY